jgi:hypothetical protein
MKFNKKIKFHNQKTTQKQIPKTQISNSKPLALHLV